MKKLLPIFWGVTIFYWPSFTARFFQDDWRLLEIAKTVPLFAPLPNFPYRPLAVQGLYSLGLNPFGFHLLLFTIFAAGLFFLYKITKSYLAVLIYAFNISLFPLFYWIATAYFTLAFFFVMAASYFYLYGNAILTTLLIILGLLSNEIVLVFPGLFFLLDFLRGRFQWKKLISLTVIDLIYFVFRQQITSGPTAPDYTLVFNPVTVIQTFRWYFLRIFNLPEGTKFGFNLMPLVLLLILLTFAVRKHLSWRLIIFAFGWFVVGALPFYFLPYHMSAYYLTLALAGPSILMANLFAKEKAQKYLFVICYLLLSVIGLNFLSQTHWIILKPTP